MFSWRILPSARAAVAAAGVASAASSNPPPPPAPTIFFTDLDRFKAFARTQTVSNTQVNIRGVVESPGFVTVTGIRMHFSPSDTTAEWSGEADESDLEHSEWPLMYAEASTIVATTIAAVALVSLACLFKRR